MCKLIYIILLCVISNPLFCQKDVKLTISKGKDALVKEDYNQALVYFDEAIELDSSFLDAYLGKAQAQYNLGFYQKSLENYNFLLSKGFNEAQCFFGLGSVNDIGFDDKSKAMQCYTKAIEISLKNNDYEYAGTCYFMRSDIKLKLGDKLGELNDLKSGATLNNFICKKILELYKQANSFGQ